MITNINKARNKNDSKIKLDTIDKRRIKDYKKKLTPVNDNKKFILSLEHYSGESIYIDKNGNKFYHPVLMNDNELKTALKKGKTKKYHESLTFKVYEQ